MQVYPIGIPPDVEINDLKDIASADSNVYQVSVDQLPDVADRLVTNVRGYVERPSDGRGKNEDSWRRCTCLSYFHIFQLPSILHLFGQRF